MATEYEGQFIKAPLIAALTVYRRNWNNSELDRKHTSGLSSATIGDDTTLMSVEYEDIAGSQLA